MRLITGLTLTFVAGLAGGCTNLGLPMSTVQDVSARQNFAAPGGRPDASRRRATGGCRHG